MPLHEESPILFLFVSANLLCRWTSAEAHLIKCETGKWTTCCLFQPHGRKRNSALMALATPPSGRGVPSGVSQGGALEAHTETAKSPMRPRAVNYLPLPPLASAPAPMLMQLCSRCSEPRQARRRRPRLVSRRHEHAHGRCCVSLDEAQGQSRQSPGCPVPADATRACDTHTPGDAAGPRHAVSTTEGFLEGIYVQKEMALQMV